jgi:hypothetical protein
MKRFLLALTALIAMSAFGAASYFGWNPATGGEALHGVLIDGGAVAGPVVSGSCGTRGTIVSGAFTGTIVGGAVTTCTTVLTFAVAAPNGYHCEFEDLTTPADHIGQASSTTTSCSSNAATVVSGDTVSFMAVGF